MFDIDPHIYPLAVLTILYPAVLVGIVYMARYKNKKQGPATTAEEKERRQNPKLRRFLNAMIGVPVIMISALVVIDTWDMICLSPSKFSRMFYVGSGAIVVYCLSLSCFIALVRYIGRKREHLAGENRRAKHPVMRQVLNALFIAPIPIIVIMSLLNNCQK